MKKLFLLILFLGSLFAFDKQQAIEAIKSDPALLNTSQAQQILKQKGVTKEQVLQKIKQSPQHVVQEGVHIANRVETPKTIELKKKEESKRDTATFTSPLRFIDESKLLAKIRSKQQREAKGALKRFAQRFFYNKNLLNASLLAVPEYYQLNPKDIVEVQIFGGIDKSLQLTVDNNGNIYVPVLGPVRVAGMSVADVKALLQSRLKPTYPNSKIVVNVKVNSFIQVSLTGYAKAPGVYNLSSVSTIKELLIAANGIGDIGSVRSVQLKRDGRLYKVVDFYDLIKDGKIVDTTLLKNGDVVYIPKATSLVKLYGAVKLPAIYELKSGEKLQDLINFAGGLLANGSKEHIKIKRYIDHRREKIYFKPLQSNFKLFNGDEIYVYRISQLNKDLVYVYGNIEKPGSYELPKSRRLVDLLKSLSYLKDTYYHYGLLEHFDGSIESFDLKSPKDMRLQSKDTLYIFSKYEILGESYVTLESSVSHSVSKFRYFDGLTLEDVINAAGFESLFYTKKIQIQRFDEEFNIHTLFVDFEKDPKFALKPYDTITVYDYSYFKPTLPIYVMGEVNKPDTYIYSEYLTLKDALNMAGWLTPKADKSYIELIRYKIKEEKREREIYRLTINDLDFLLKPYDEITVKRVPKWGEVKSVEIRGQVKYPGRYIIKTGDRLADVIKRAGGFSDEAYLYAAVFTRESVRKLQEERLHKLIYKLKKRVSIIAASAKGAGEHNIDAQNLMSAIDTMAKESEKLKPIGRIAIKLDRDLDKFAKSSYNIVLEDKDKLYIPSKKDAVVVMGEVLNEGAFVYESKNAIDYIKKAGGVLEDAGDVYFVVHANGLSEKGYLGGWLDRSIYVRPGDAIVVPLEIKTSTWYGITKDMSAILYQLAVTAASLKTVGAL